MPNEQTPLLRDRTDGQYGVGSEDVPTRTQSETHPTPDLPFRVVAYTCTALWCVTFLCAQDATIVAMLLGNISSAFHASEKSSWIGSTFLLSVCCASPLFGRLCDIIGKKKSILIALLCFSIGTLFCASAPSMTQFLVARTIAGIGAGGLVTAISVIMTHLVPLHSRGIYQGLTNIVFGLGVGTGAPVGGVLNDTVGWRGAFYIQVPILVITFFALMFLLEHDEPTHAPQEPSLLKRLKDVDMLGLVVFSIAPITALWAMDRVSVQDKSLTDPYVLTGLCTSIAALVLFYFVERHGAAVPLVSLDIYALRSGWSSLWANFFVSVGLFAYNYNFPLFFQTVGGLSASTVGVRMMPASIALSVGSLLAGFYMRATGRYYWYNAGCMLLAAIFTIPAAFFNTNPATIAPFVYNIPQAFGCAGMLTCTLLALINCVDKSTVGVTTGMNYLFRTTGQVLGVSVSGAILQSLLARNLRYWIVGPDAEALIAKIRHEATIIPSLPPQFQGPALQSYANALQCVFWLVLLAQTIAFVMCLYIEDKPLKPAGGVQLPSDEEEVL
ncbi:hypothetical protein MVES1_002178 [Malassezia vespertilionis]|uniref:Major facilitator superfamily (MFS) profile domain-containing protein n=1 Tax=Malassezia vespertilionis TaxID=2020962 RepID=A0A2N1JBY1_9BASI|nr:uncharacterized protein MVES1_002178 [Malassezia vespertilionis]PKI84032.1 hypothetical protein MVES_002054 [Malassezia vespertilionis]WFD06824.1 hypothetical protein MVES1_002178 [Malassezia vespertilionis]